MAEPKDKEIKKKMLEMKKLNDQQAKLAVDLMKLSKDNNDQMQQIRVMQNLMKNQHKAAMNVIKNMKG